jgi:hypothetical protein
MSDRSMREPLHNDVVPAVPADRHLRHRRHRRRSQLLNWLVVVMVAVMVGGAFVIGTRMQPKPIAPAASQVIQTKCTINTEQVRVAVEGLRDVVNRHRNGKLTTARFDTKVADQIPKIADAVRSQTVSCKQATP